MVSSIVEVLPLSRQYRKDRLSVYGAVAGIDGLPSLCRLADAPNTQFVL